MAWGERRESGTLPCEIEFCPRPSMSAVSVCEVHWREFLRWLDQKSGRQTVDL